MDFLFILSSFNTAAISSDNHDSVLGTVLQIYEENN